MVFFAEYMRESGRVGLFSLGPLGYLGWVKPVRKEASSGLLTENEPPLKKEIRLGASLGAHS